MCAMRTLRTAAIYTVAIGCLFYPNIWLLLFRLGYSDAAGIAKF